MEQESWFQELVQSECSDASTQILELGASSPGFGNQQTLESVDSVIRSLGFTPVKRIGQGAFSRVFLAQQESLANRYVVVKAVKRTFDEAEHLAELQHTNIVPIYSFHRCGPWSLLCMPYAGLVTLADYFSAIPDSNLRSGLSLVSTIQCSRDVTWTRTETADVANRQPRDIEDVDRDRDVVVSPSISPLHRDALALWFFSRVVDALCHAHARGILHGDIKPANLLIRNDGEPALLDFNLAQKFDDSDASARGGTLPYMSPESMRSLMGLSSPIAAESDIYSLGIVMYQFLTGRFAYPPPQSAAPADLEVAITQREARVTWEVADKVSPAIRAIVEKCLAPTAAQRYSTADQLHEDLECERWSLPLKHARERSLRHRARKWIGRHPRVTSAASVTAAAAAIILVMSLVVWRVVESKEKLVAHRTFQQFEARARRASAELLSVGRTDQTEAIRDAIFCLSTYQVLDNERWGENKSWSLLTERDQQTALALMTNLMLKVSWNRIENDNLIGTIPSGVHSQSVEAASRAMKVLAQEPFASQAPLAIGLLSQSVNRPNDSQISPPRFELTPAQAMSLSPLDQVGIATTYIEQENGEAALKLLPAGLLRLVDEYTYWITLGRTQMLMPDLRGAELSFSLVIESLPKAAAAFHYRGICRMKMLSEVDKRKAVTDFSAALERQPDAFVSLKNRAITFEALGDLKAAGTDLKTLTDHDPRDAQALIMQSRVLRKLNKQEESGKALEAALQCRPTTALGWISISLARLPTDKHGALRDLLHAQRLAPNSIEVLQNLAHVYSEHLDEPEKAIASLDRLLEIKPEFELAIMGRAVLHARNGDSDAALHDIESVIDAKGKLLPSSLYQAACVFALLLTHSDDDPDSVRFKNNAFAYLSAALQKGYGAEFFETDQDLAPLKDDVRFQNAVSLVRSGRSLLNLQR